MSICEKCWGDAKALARESGMSQYDAYKMILANQRDVHELEDENQQLRVMLDRLLDESERVYLAYCNDGTDLIHLGNAITRSKKSLQELP